MKKLKKLIISLTLSAVMTIPVTLSYQGNQTTVSAATIKISTKSCTIVKGKSKTLSISGTKKKITWKSSKPSIATVSSKGKVTAKKAGTTTITATVNKKKFTCKVTVKNPVNKYISSAPFKAVERKVGDITFVVPESWGFSLDKSDPTCISADMLTDGETGSSVYIECEKTGEKAINFSTLKEHLEEYYTPKAFEEAFSKENESQPVEIKNFTTSEFKTNYGSAYKTSFTVTLTIDGVTMQQTAYDLCIDNYYILLIATDTGEGNLESMVDYIMRSLTSDK